MKKKIIVIFVCIILIATATPMVEAVKNNFINVMVANASLKGLDGNWTEIQKLLVLDDSDLDYFDADGALDGLFFPFVTAQSRNLTTSAQLETETVIVNITRPLNHSFYIRNIRLFSRSGITFVYGSFIIAAKATSDEKIRRVNFYVNGILRKIDFLPPYTYDFTPKIGFRHTITVRAFDAGGNTGSASITVFCWRMHPILLLSGAYVLYRLISSKR